MLRDCVDRTLGGLLALLGLRGVRRKLFHNRDRSLNLHRIFNNRIINRTLCTTGRAIPRRQLMRSFRDCFLHPNSDGGPVVCSIRALHSNGDFDTHQITTVRGNGPVFCVATSFRTPRTNFRRRGAVPSTPTPSNLPSRARVTRSLTRLLPPILGSGFVYSHPLRIHPIRFRGPLGNRITRPRHRI